LDRLQEFRQSLSFEAVLRHYSVELKIKDKQHTASARCRTIKAKGFAFLLGKFGEGHIPCFRVRSKRQRLGFAAMMENVDPANGAELRNVAVKLQARFCPAAVQAERAIPREQEKKADATKGLLSSSMRRWILNSRGWTARTRICVNAVSRQKRLRISASASLHAGR